MTVQRWRVKISLGLMTVATEASAYDPFLYRKPAIGPVEIILFYLGVSAVVCLLIWLIMDDGR